jgi:hypothetical protein
MFIIKYLEQSFLVEAKPRLRKVPLFGPYWFWQCTGASLCYTRATADEAYSDWLWMHTYQLCAIQQGINPLSTNESQPS